MTAAPGASARRGAKSVGRQLLFRHAAATDARRAHPKGAAGAIDHDANLAQIRIPSAVSHVVGVTYPIAIDGALTADFTSSCHTFTSEVCSGLLPYRTALPESFAAIHRRAPSKLWPQRTMFKYSRRQRVVGRRSRVFCIVKAESDSRQSSFNRLVSVLLARGRVRTMRLSAAPAADSRLLRAAGLRSAGSSH